VFGQRSADFVLTDVPGLLWMAIRTDPFLFWNAVSLAAFQVANFLLYWVAASGWRGVDVQAQTFAPYGRVAVVHLTILLAAVPVTVIGEPLIAVVCLALLKTALEVGLTWRKAPLPSPSERLT